ncbi:hypothetical protein WMY93_003322 [Mugilogobius chulae]|uniref:Uncharacterized protein n=1 Tax=Mugilogobius chulae TaxID=88201 RepID=A0AAW0QBB9_9GOBI
MLRRYTFGESLTGATEKKISDDVDLIRIDRRNDATKSHIYSATAQIVHEKTNPKHKVINERPRSVPRYQRIRVNQTFRDQKVYEEHIEEQRQQSMEESIEQSEQQKNQHLEALRKGAERLLAVNTAHTDGVTERMAFDENRMEQIQEQENRRMAAVSKHAEDLLSRDAARSERLLERMGLQNRFDLQRSMWS